MHVCHQSVSLKTKFQGSGGAKGRKRTKLSVRDVLHERGSVPLKFCENRHDIYKKISHYVHGLCTSAEAALYRHAGPCKLWQALEKASARNLVESTKSAVSQLGQPTKEQLSKQRESFENVYSAQQNANEPEDDVIPAVITDRMLRRVITFAGIPVFVGLMLFPCFWYLKVVKDVELPMGLVFVVQSIVFGTGLLGITYGATSASWDPNMEGSKLGWNEFRANLAAIMGKVK